MDVKLIISLISAAVALIGAAISVHAQKIVARQKFELDLEKDAELRKRQAREVLARYRDPLLRVAYDLQSRIFNIVLQDLLSVYHRNGDEREREYVEEHTLYVFAQYFCWTEIIRNNVQFLDLGDVESTMHLATLQTKISQLFLTDEFGKDFRVFRGEQRAIGEAMAIKDGDGVRCYGFSKFVLEKRDDIEYWLGGLRESLRKLSDDWGGVSHAMESSAESLPRGVHRLVLLQHALVELIDFLDPECTRFPKEVRGKIL